MGGEILSGSWGPRQWKVISFDSTCRWTDSYQVHRAPTNQAWCSSLRGPEYTPLGKVNVNVTTTNSAGVNLFHEDNLWAWTAIMFSGLGQALYSANDWHKHTHRKKTKVALASRREKGHKSCGHWYKDAISSSILPQLSRECAAMWGPAGLTWLFGTGTTLTLWPWLFTLSSGALFLLGIFYWPMVAGNKNVVH